MLAAGEPVQLRPLSLGEIFDRAVTLYTRHAPVFTLIALIEVVPLAVLNYFAGLHESSTFAQIIDQVQHPSKTVSAADANIAMALTFGMVAAAVVLGAFVIVAIAAAVGKLYASGRAEFGAAYASALRRTGAIVLVLLCQIASFGAVAFAGAIGMSIVFVAAFLLVRSSASLGVLVLIAAAIAGILWFIALLLCYVAFAFAFDAVAIEGAPAGAAVGRAFSRIFNRSELLRAVLVCLSLVAIYIGLMVISVSVAAVFESLHLHVMNVLVNALVSLVSVSFIGVLLAVYYFDVRVRREGLDMQAQIAGLQATATSP